MARLPTQDFQGNQRFQLVTRIGEGGMGVVYEAIDREQNMRVALKALRTLSPDTLLRFKNEFRALADIQHPNLISFYELIEDQGQWFLSMELVTGVDFLSYVRPMTGPDGRPIAATDAQLGPETPMSTGVFPKASMKPVHGSGFDVNRLRDSIAQLARGLTALHAAGKIHRDIKPMNIRVTPQGRVVVLDFGLVRDSDRDARASEVHVVGTAAYMAPEQAASKVIGPPADWYAVGVLLFESLTGKLPFSGRPLQILTDKQRLEPLPPRAFAPEVPPDLDALAVDLLKIDPAARPDGEAILKRMAASPLPEVGSSPQRMPAAPTTFVGRTSELEQLGAAFADVRKGRAVAVVVHGESGVGKTSLVKQFTERRAAEDPMAVILHGRCYERETVPYKAVDGVIDALSRFLARVGRDEAEAVLPRQVALLAQVFPVLRRVEAVAQLGKTSRAVLDPHELRTRVFAAVRELFARLAERRSLILAIDDMQWADADSLALLAEVFRPPDAPPILLLATVRGRGPSDPGRSGAHAVAATITPDARHLDLHALPRADAEKLARSLLDDTAAIAAVVDEAGGHPLFIAELARHAAGGSEGDAVRLRLDEALYARVARLPPKHRRLLELIAVAGAPLLQELAAHAAEIEFGELGNELAALRSANLVRTSGARSSDVVEPYHDRVREAVMGHLDAEARRACHERLALAMEGARQQDEETLAAHWQGAGRNDKASQHAATAADQASSALAFDRAARLYRTALEMRGGGGDTTLELKLATALANAGRGKDAAEIYLRAAERAQGKTHEALELRRIASEQLLRTGHIDRGLEVLDRVLAEMGFSLPATQEKGFLPLLYWRARVRLRGLSFKERDPREVRPLELQKIDVCWSVAASLGMVDHVRSALFQAMNLVRALKAGDRGRIVRALAVEAVGDAAISGAGSKRAARLVTAVRELSDRMATPESAAWGAFATGTVAHVEGRWRPAREALDRAETLFRDHCRGFGFEIANAHAFATAALYYLGEYAELARRTSAFLQQAEDRGDVFTATTQRIGLATTRWLMEDAPARAMEELDAGMRMWSHREDFHMQHLFELTGRVEILLYQGDGVEAWQRVEGRWKAIVGSHLLRIQYLRIEAHWARARAALAASRAGNSEALLAEAASDARKLHKEHAPWAAALATLIEAGIARARGQREAAIGLLRSAEKQLEALDMPGFVAATRRRLGELIGGTVGDELILTGDEALTTRDVKAPLKFAAMLAP